MQSQPQHAIVAPCGWCVARKHRPIVHAILSATTPVSHQSLHENQQTRRGSAHQGLVLLPHRSSVATRCGHERRQPVRHVMQAPVDGAWALDHRAVDEARPSHASLKIRPLSSPQGPVLSAVRALSSAGIYLLAFERGPLREARLRRGQMGTRPWCRSVRRCQY